MTSGNGAYRGTKEYLIVYCELIQAARYQGLTTYQEIAQIMGLPLTGNLMGREVGEMIGRISEDEISQGRPMLSAVVVSTRGKPSPGFYRWAYRLGRTDSDEEDVDYWERELKQVHEAWQRTYEVK